MVLLHCWTCYGLQVVMQKRLQLRMPHTHLWNNRILTHYHRLIKVDLRKHPQGTRFVVLTVMDKLMAKHRNGTYFSNMEHGRGLIDIQ